LSFVLLATRLRRSWKKVENRRAEPIKSVQIIALLMRLVNKRTLSVWNSALQHSSPLECYFLYVFFELGFGARLNSLRIKRCFFRVEGSISNRDKFWCREGHVLLHLCRGSLSTKFSNFLLRSGKLKSSFIEKNVL
jgi:hypothetical protein